MYSIAVRKTSVLKIKDQSAMQIPSSIIEDKVSETYTKTNEDHHIIQFHAVILVLVQSWL